MATKPAVNVVITGDAKDLDKALKGSAGALGGFAKVAAGTFGGALLTKGFDAAVGGLKAVAGFALEGVGKLDEMGDAVARLDTLTKGLGDTATAADLSRFGVDKGEQAKSALAIANTGKALKLTDKQLTNAVPTLDLYAAQLASLGDGDPVKQAELLAKALGGSAKAAKALGIVLPKGKDATPTANLAAIVGQLGPKLKQATSGTASLADVGDRWDATLANIQLALAGFLDKLAPVVSQLLDVLMPVLQRFIDTVGPLVAQAFGAIADAVAGFLADGGGEKVAGTFASIMSILGELATFITTYIVPALGKIAKAIGDAVAPLLPKIQELWTNLKPVLEQFASFFNDVIVPVLVNVVIPAIGKLIGFFLDLASAFFKNLGPALSALGRGFNVVMTAIQPVIDAIAWIIDNVGKAVGALGSIHIPGINVAPPAPAGASSRSGTSVNLTINTGVGDPVAIGRQVARYLGAYAGRGGAIA